MGKKFKRLPRDQKVIIGDRVLGYAKVGDQSFILLGDKWTNRVEVKVA